jgi:hypothetical protein
VGKALEAMAKVHARQNKCVPLVHLARDAHLLQLALRGDPLQSVNLLQMRLLSHLHLHHLRF